MKSRFSNLQYIVNLKREIHHIDEIFEKAADNHSFAKDASFYHDLLNYSFAINPSIFNEVPFRLSELQNWMVQNSKEIVEYYKDLSTRNIPISKRVSYRKERIKSKFEDLIKLRLIYILGTTKAEKVNVDIPLYAYTKFGILLALVIKSQNLKKLLSFEKQKGDQNKILNYQKDLENNNQIIYELFDSVLKIGEDYPYAYVFYNDLFKKIKEKGLFGKLVDHIILLCNSNLSIQSMEQLFLILLDFGLNDKEDRRNFLNLFHETIEELEPGVKELVLYQMKLSAERRFESKKRHLSRSYERERFNHRDDYENIVLEGDCENCKLRSIVIWDYIEYRKIFSSLNRKDPIRLDCGNCGAKSSFIISNF